MGLPFINTRRFPTENLISVFISDNGSKSTKRQQCQPIQHPPIQHPEGGLIQVAPLSPVRAAKLIQTVQRIKLPTPDPALAMVSVCAEVRNWAVQELPTTVVRWRLRGCGRCGARRRTSKKTQIRTTTKLADVLTKYKKKCEKMHNSHKL